MRGPSPGSTTSCTESPAATASSSTSTCTRRTSFSPPAGRRSSTGRTHAAAKLPWTRRSQLFLPTLRDDPADAEAVSHKLLARGGFVRQLAAGLWSFTPLGWRVHRKIEQIIREELNAIGAQEWLAPVLTPVELWEATGRAGIPEIFHLQDRAGRRFILPMTHEETFTFHARELQSYKQLPQAWYHFQTKDRDEPRPRGGLLRVREFIMKDSYSF